MRLIVSELAERIGAEVCGDGSGYIGGVGPLEAADSETISFVSSGRHVKVLGQSGAGAVIVSELIKDVKIVQLVVGDVNAALIEVLGIFAPVLKSQEAGIDPSAKVADDVKTGEGVSIGPCAVIDSGVEIGPGTVIGSGCRIGENTRIGSGCRFDSNVVVYHNCVIGNNVIIQANSTIGSTGFGYAFVEGSHRLIPHNGGVVIEDFVEIGSNSCIDRAKFDNTVIGAGTKIDNLVQIAHNAVIGKCCLIAGQVGIAGSVRLGDGVIMGGNSGVSDQVEIGAGTMVGTTSVVLKDVGPGHQLFGTPAIDKLEAIRVLKLTRRLPKLAEQLKQLIARIEKLESSKDDKD